MVINEKVLKVLHYSCKYLFDTVCLIFYRYFCRQFIILLRNFLDIFR